MMNDEIRTLEQNKRFHAMVKDISDQVLWAGDRLDPEDWKRLILAGAYGQRVVPNPIGDGFVVMNKRRSRGLVIPEMSELIEQLFAFGADNGVEWSDPSLPPVEAYEEIEGIR